MQKIPLDFKSLFSAHATTIDKIFGPAPERPIIGRISDKLNSDLFSFITRKITSSSDDVVSSPQSAMQRIHEAKFNSALLLTRTELIDFDELFETINCHVELNPFDPLVASLHSELRQIFSLHIGSPFSFVNSRAFISRPGASDVGPFRPHTDNFADGHLKIMVYPSGINALSGGIRFTDFEPISQQPPGVAVLFDNSKLQHMAISSANNPRLGIELTLLRTLTDIRQLNRSHFFGRHLKTPGDLYRAAHSSTVSDAVELSAKSPDAINVGSGIRNWGSKWLLLDALDHPAVSQIKVNSESLFPAPSEQASLVYSSHHIEHLPDASVRRVVKEAHRCLKPGGRLLLKIPNFDLFIQAFLAADFGLKDQIGVGKVMWSWHNKGVQTTPENIFSMMFCGYWTKEYGDHFSGEINKSSPLAYHGPADVSPGRLGDLFKSKDPHFISAELCKVALEDPYFSAFNHQNAWSEAQLVALVEAEGFQLHESSRDSITKLFADQIPDLREMADWSLYLLFERNLTT